MNLPAFSGRKKSINLLPKDSFESSGVGVILSWALAFGKWTVIVTQLVVMGAFLYRFVLDRQVTNLRKEIDQQKAIIGSYSQIEDDFAMLQERLTFAKPALAAQKSLSDELTLLQSITPTDVWYERLNISKDTLQFTAYSSSLTGFSQFINAIQHRKEFASVSVARIENGGASGSQLSFDVTIRLGAPQNAK
jgi:Tfp pilus assembly protein PilN